MLRWLLMFAVFFAAGAARSGAIPSADTARYAGVAVHAPSAPWAPVVVDLPVSPPVTVKNASEWVRVYVDSRSLVGEELLPIQGRYDVSGTSVRFYPVFPFEAEQSYRVEVTPAGAEAVREVFALPARSTHTKPRVVRIFPSSAVLPATTLRFYVQFSEPMRVHFRREMVRLNDATGTELKDAFVNYGQELWSADGMRLTLYVDPSRIKRGVTALETAGPLLREGSLLDLVVDAVASNTGAGSRESVAHRRFRVATPLRRPLDTREWHIHAPAAGSTQPYVVRFDRVMDRALLEDCLQVVDAKNHPVRGHRVIDRAETAFEFWPSQPWDARPHALIVAPELEDVSGNRLGEALDHAAGAQRPPDVPTTIPFTPLSQRFAGEPATNGRR